MNTLTYYEGKKEFNVFVASTFLDLVQFKKETIKLPSTVCC